jgi:hypothetical protein
MQSHINGVIIRKFSRLKNPKSGKIAKNTIMIYLEWFAEKP